MKLSLRMKRIEDNLGFVLNALKKLLGRCEYTQELDFGINGEEIWI